MGEATQKTSNELSQERTGLSIQRTLMSADRTLMSWVRTALSMIGFGFTIYKVLEGLQEKGFALPNEHSPRNMGLFLTALGTVSIAMGILEYAGVLRGLAHHQPVRLGRPVFAIALILFAAGLFLFGSIVAGLF